MTNLIYETQDSFYEYIVRVAQGAETIASDLREDRIGEALQLIVQFSEGVSWLIQVILLMRENNYSININPSEMNEFLVEINDGLERQDYIIVADMFEYEIKPFFEEAAKEKFHEMKEEKH
ncbi:hypothetical protein [Anoxybacteroides rupiense]|uniref:hypothetical protein n=1 Tax=Anoxybacteroides rupiense TaxID=311460 RepID=UPI00160641E2|nr:hypothetical protein [Anoxybacillus rupiensis]MBB3908594.1 hypothetical protein [Anoxybacillus rupiensis]